MDGRQCQGRASKGGLLSCQAKILAKRILFVMKILTNILSYKNLIKI
jgi:hypothetical protein